MAPAFFLKKPLKAAAAALLICGLAGAGRCAPPAGAAMPQDDSGLTAALSRKIKAYQESKDCKGMIGLFYDKGNSARRREAMGDTIREYICGNFDRKISSVAFQTIPPDQLRMPGDYEGKPSAYSLKPLGAVVIDYGEGAPGQAKSLTFLYGEHDHRMYLITTKKADHR